MPVNSKAVLKKKIVLTVQHVCTHGIQDVRVKNWCLFVSVVQLVLGRETTISSP